MKSGGIFKYILFNLLRSRFFIFYTALFLVLGFSIIYLGKDSSKSLITISNLVLLIVPLFSIIAGSIHYYNSREFNEMLLTQPIRRSSIYYGQYLGISSSMALGFALGTGTPLLLFSAGAPALFILITGILLTYCFTALAFFISVRNNDKAKGIGLSVIYWFYFSVLYDGIVLLLLYLMKDYPMEKGILLLTALNPIDTARIIVLMQLDISALMGATAAIYQDIFGTMAGITMSFSVIAVWVLIPLYSGKIRFTRKDF